MEHMENTQAAEETRNARRRAQNRRQLQKGGVIYASEARQMVKRKEDTELEKAENQLRRAQNAKKKAEHERHKPFLDGIKAGAKMMAKKRDEKAKAMEKERRVQQTYKKKISKLIIAGIRLQARLRNLM